MIKVEEVITKLEVVPIWIGKEEILEVQAKPEELEVQAKPEALIDETDWIGKKATLEDITKLEMILIWIGKEATPGVITKPEEAPEAQAKLEESEVIIKPEVEADQVH